MIAKSAHAILTVMRITCSRMPLIAALAAVLAVIPAGLVAAHDLGASFEATKEGYFMDIGYSPEQPVAGETVQFDMSALFEAETQEAIDFKSVWLRVNETNSNAVPLATGISRPTLGPTTLLYAFPKAGTYELSFRYEDEENKSIVEEAFTLSVSEPERERSLNLPIVFGAGFMGLVLGAIGVRALYGRSA